MAQNLLNRILMDHGWLKKLLSLKGFFIPVLKFSSIETPFYLFHGSWVVKKRLLSLKGLLC